MVARVSMYSILFNDSCTFFTSHDNDFYVNNLLVAMNVSYVRSIKMSPYEAVFGQKPNIRCLPSNLPEKELMANEAPERYISQC